MKREFKEVGTEVEKTGKKAKNAADRDFKDLEKSMKSAAVQGNVMGELIGRAFDYILRAGVQVVQMLYGMVKGFADAGVEIYKAQQVTQLSAETLSAIAMQARRTGTSISEVGDSFKEFTKLIGDAANGSKDAVAKMARLGIDPVKAANNLDAAYRQVIARIVSLKNPVEQGNAAMDAFGETGYKLLPFLKSFDGDLDKLMQTARELGVVMTEQDVKAAKEFDRSYKDLQETVRGLAMTFGRDYLPILKDVIDRSKVWFTENKALIQSWATSSSNAVRGFIISLEETKKWFEENPRMARFLWALTGLGSPAAMIYNYMESKGASGSPLATQPNYDPSLNKIPDLTKSPTGNYFSAPGSVGKAPKVGRSATPELTDQQKQAIELQRIIKDLTADIAFFGQDTEEAALQQKFFEVALLGTNKALFDQARDLARNKDAQKAKQKADEDAAEAAQKYADTIKQFREEGIQSTFDAQNNNAQEMWQLSQQIELGRELNDVDLQQIQNSRELVEFAAATINFKKEDVDLLFAELLKKHELVLVDKERIVQLKEELALKSAVRDIQKGLQGELAELTEIYRTGAEVTTVFRIEQELLKDTYKGLSDEQRQQILSTAAQIDSMKAAMKAQEEAHKQYEQFRDTILDGLDAMQDGAGSFFSWMYDRFKNFLKQMVAEWLASKFFNMFYGGGNAQAAQGSGSGGGGIAGAIRTLLGGGQGPGGTPMFNGNATQIYGGPTQTISNSGSSQLFNTLNLRGGGTYTAGGSGGGWASMFTGEGGLFAPVGGSRIGGYLSGAGTLASVFGGLIPGRAGSAISSGGTGMALGAQIGALIPVIGPIVGALVGGGIGALFGWLFGNKAEKKDKKEKMPQLMQGFTDSMKQLRDLINDVRTLRIDPDSAISQATQIRQQIASGFGVQFESKKYQKESQKLIAQRLVEADSLITELRNVSEISRAASERERRLLPEFAGGVYMSPAFRRFNGMLSGAWTGRDTIPAMVAAGEMILNPMQQARVRSNAGGDPFRGAGIPGYADGGVVQSGYGDMNLTVYIEQDASGQWVAIAESDRGQRSIAKVVAGKYKNGELTLQKRLG